MSEEVQEVVEEDVVIDQIAEEVIEAPHDYQEDVNELKGAIQSCITLLDPTGCRHVESGSPAEYQEVLDKLYEAAEA